MRVVPSLALARLRHRPSRWLLVALGVATAAALPVFAQGSATVVASQALAHGLADLPPGARSLIVSYPDVVMADGDLHQLDVRVKAALSTLSSGPVKSQLLFRRIADLRGGTFFLGAADHLGASVRVVSGRLPASCTPTRCEVVQLGSGAPALDPTLGIVVVGQAVRTDPLLLKGTFDPGNDAPLLLADGVAAAQRLAALEQFQRSYGWFAPLDLGRVSALGVDGYLARSAATSDGLWAAAAGTVLTAPDDVLRAEQARAQLSARRFALLGGSSTVLLLGFAVIGAVGLRRDHATLLALLRRRGATRRTVRALTTVEALVPVTLGAVLGLALGAAGAAVMAARSGLAGGATAWAAVTGAAVAALVTLLVAAGAVVATLGWPTGESAGADRSAWRVVDAVVVACAATALLAIARGSVSAAGLGASTDPLLLTLPVLVVVSGGLLAARLWPWTAGVIARAMPHRWLAGRLGLLGSLRRPLRPVATVAFLTGATAVVVFTGAYRTTLQQGAVDQAVFSVPLDARLTTGSGLERPYDVSDPTTYGRLTPGSTAHPVVRAGAAIRVSAAEAVPLEIIGVDPAALPLVRSWSHVVGSLDPDEAARLLREHPVAQPSGIPVPAGTVALAVPVTGTVEQLSVVAWLRDSAGRDHGVELAASAGRLVAAVPPAAQLTALTVTESTEYATKHQHNIGEGSATVSVLAGRVTLGLPSFRATDGTVTTAGPDAWAGWGSATAQVPAGARSLSVDYQLTGQRIVVVAGFVADPAPLPVLVDPVTAGRAVGGRLTLSVTGGAALPVRVVGVVPRFPTVGATFAVVDVSALADRLDVGQPGTGASTEVWVAVPDGQQAALATTLRGAPYDRLTVALQAEREESLRTDPVAEGAVGLLVAGALLALVVGALALVLLVVAERRDESAEFYAWESDGVAPATLRRVLFVRALAVAVLAVPAGLVLGLLLSRLTTALVTVTAVGSTPVPPLTLSVGLGWVGAVLLVGLGLAVAAAGAVAWGALREQLPPRPEGDLR